MKITDLQYGWKIVHNFVFLWISINVKRCVFSPLNALILYPYLVTYSQNLNYIFIWRKKKINSNILMTNLNFSESQNIVMIWIIQFLQVPDSYILFVTSNYQNKSTIHNLNIRTQLILKVIIERHLFLNHDLDLFPFWNLTEYISD